MGSADGRWAGPQIAPALFAGSAGSWVWRHTYRLRCFRTSEVRAGGSCVRRRPPFGALATRDGLPLPKRRALILADAVSLHGWRIRTGAVFLGASLAFVFCAVGGHGKASLRAQGRNLPRRLPESPEGVPLILWQRFVDREVLRWDGAKGRNGRGGTLAYPRASGGDMVN